MRNKEINNAKNKLKIIGLEEKNFPIEFVNLTYVYNKKTPYEFKALNNINLKIKPKIITSIIGSTGSGKSTLIQHINGLLLPTEGKVKINDFELTSKTKKIKQLKSLRKSIGLVFQFPEYQLFERTVLEDIMFGAINMGAKKIEAEKIAKKVLKTVNLDEQFLEHSPFNLSGGQKRRVALAGILALEGTTLILDEPTAGLDPQGEKDFIKLFKFLNYKDEKRIIMITHNMDDVLKISDEVIFLDKSKIIFQGSPFDLFQNKEILGKYNIKLPNLYTLINKLNQKGFNFKDKKIRTIDELTTELIKQMKGETKI